MTILTPERLAEIEALAKKATPGPWEADSMKSEGSYGIGDETYEGFNAFRVTDEKGNAICDTLNSDMGEVHVEYDEDDATAWDEIGRRNAAYIAALDPQTVLALLASHAALAAEVERLRRELAFSEQTSAARNQRICQLLEEKLADRESAAREMREARWIATERNLPYAHHFYLGNKSEYGRKFRWEVDDSVTYWVFEGGLSWFCRLAVDGREEWTKQCGTKDEAMRFAEQDSLALPLTPTKEPADG